MNTYDPGDGVTLSTTFRSESTGELADPDEVYLDVRLHTEPEPTTYQYGVGDVIVRDAEGTYHALVEPDTHGLWHYGWRGTGLVIGAEQGGFLVRRWRPGTAEAAS